MLITAVGLTLILKQQGMLEAVRLQLDAIRSDDIAKAYEMTSSDFQREAPYRAFKVFVDQCPALKQHKNIIFHEQKTVKNFGYLKGVLYGMDDNKTLIEYQLIKEENEWKIHGIGVSIDANELAGESSISDDIAVINAILVSDIADADGYVESGKAVISPLVDKIFVTIQLMALNMGEKVNVTLTNLNTGGIIGPVSGEATKLGYIMKAFSFTRGQDAWPSGEYEVDVSTSTGAVRKASFLVQ